jgi:hypothetical protein
LLLLVILVAALYLGRRPLLQAAAGFLIVDDATGGADCVLLLEDDGPYLDQAAQLVHEGSAREILIVTRQPDTLERLEICPPRTEQIQQALRRRGIEPPKCILLPANARTDWDVARAVRDWLGGHPQDRLLTVCGRLHSRRGRFVFRHVLDGDEAAHVHFRAVADADFDETNWWQHREGALDFFRSWVLLTYVCLCGEDTAEWQPWDPDQYDQNLPPRP